MLFLEKLLVKIVFGIILMSTNANCKSFDSNSVIIKREREKELNNLRSILRENISMLDKAGYSEEKFVYMYGEDQGRKLFIEINSIKSKYNKPVGKSFDENWWYLEDAKTTIMSAYCCINDYHYITNKLIKNEVPAVTGEQMAAYVKGNFEDTTAALYRGFFYSIKMNKKCKAYNIITNKILKNRHMAFVDKYASDERLYYYLDSMSIDSLRNVFNEIHQFSKRELSILTKWKEEHSLQNLFRNIIYYYDELNKNNNRDSVDENEKDEIDKIVGFFKEKNTVKMFDYWDEKFIGEENKYNYSEIREFVKKLQTIK